MKTRSPVRRQFHLEELEGRLVPSASSVSTNWSGYAVTANPGSVTAVSASWVVPAVTGSGTAYSSAWVGIDGYTSSTVEQIGTDSDVVNGKATYYAWYEMYPSGSINLSLKVQAGDTISAKVSYAANGFNLQIDDGAQSLSITKHAAGAQRSSAEWIQEAPSSGSGVLPLSNFGTINFTKAQATIGGKTGPIDNPAWSNKVVSINMASSFGNTTQATTSALKDSGSAPTSSFSVTDVPPVSTSTGTSGKHGGGGPGGLGWWWRWRAPDMQVTQTSGMNAAGINDDTLFPSQSLAPAATQSPSSIANLVATAFTAASPFNQTGSAPVRTLASVSSSVGGADPQALPQVLAIGGEPDAPVEPLVPPTMPDVPSPRSNPDAPPMPPMNSPFDPPPESGAYGQSWRLASPLLESPTGIALGDEAATGTHFTPDLVFSLALGGVWGMATQPPPARKQRLMLR